ncbi:MAG TPA: hypothetical protein VNO30_33225 [Kofleriaceae bacterium]|nr:hypothetical protein [Kofleriaceae bacterium]
MWNVNENNRHFLRWKTEDTGRWLINRNIPRDDEARCHPARPPALSGEAVLVKTFNELRDSWRNETAHLSSMTARVLHPSYQRIIGLGPRVLPLLLAELRDRPAQWTWALRAIAGEDPVSPEAKGALRKERDAWLHWGRQRGMI